MFVIDLFVFEDLCLRPSAQSLTLQELGDAWADNIVRSTVAAVFLSFFHRLDYRSAALRLSSIPPEPVSPAVPFLHLLFHNITASRARSIPVGPRLKLGNNKAMLGGTAAFGAATFELHYGHTPVKIK